MKTTIDIDEDKIIRVMELTGIKTRKDAVDYALSEVERMARIRKLMEGSLYVSEGEEVIDPAYDLMRLREKEKPR